MYRASSGGDVHGDSPHHVMASLYTKASMSTLFSGVLLTMAGVAATAVLGSKMKGTVR